MAYYYFPSCKATAQFKEASKAAREYVNQKFGNNKSKLGLNVYEIA